jgi:hypothetical protein
MDSVIVQRVTFKFVIVTIIRELHLTVVDKSVAIIVFIVTKTKPT